MNEIELIVILGFYIISKEKGIDKFTAQYNSCFGKDVSKQTILHEVSIFKNIDPSNNVKNHNDNSVYRAVWDEFITKDKISELKYIYNCFKKGDFIPLTSKQKNEDIRSDSALNSIIDEPKEIPEKISVVLEKFNRSSSVSTNALALAGYKCEGNCGNELFLKKDGVHNYTEAHHLIPLSFQESFEYSLDVEANVVSLCPMCHCLLHYGFDNRDLLKSLYDKRKERLSKAGILISYEKLLFLYAAGVAEEE